jgi:hypothetical protein
MLLVTACGGERTAEPLSEWESADLQAAVFNFQVYPDARFKPEQTELLRRAHFVLNPGATAAPPLAVYESESPFEAVRQWYGERYGLAEPPLREGELQADAAAIEPIARQLELEPMLTQARGRYQAADLAATGNLPRLTIQRPYFDLIENQVVDRTLIILTRD